MSLTLTCTSKISPFCFLINKTLSTGAINGDKNLAFVTTSGTSITNSFNSEVSTGSQLVHEDLEQIHDDDLKEMDLKWNMALLSMRARKFYQRIGRKIIVDGSNTAGFDKSKTVRIEDTPKKAICAIDGVGFDWSDMAEEQTQTNMALMAFSDSELGQLRIEIEKVKQEKEGIDLKIAKFDKSAKDLDEMLKSLDEFKEPENTDDSLEQHQVTKHQVSDRESSSTKSPSKVDKETVKDWKEKFFHPARKVESDKPKHSETPVQKTVRYAKMYRSQRLIVLMKSGLKNLNTVRPVNTVRSVNTSRPISTARSKVVNTARPLVNTVRANGVNALNDKGFVDSGCSRHMTGNLAYLLNFKEFNGGNVTFGGGAYGRRITGKGTLKTNNHDFEDLPDENQILLRIPREDNMYSFNMHNIVPKENLTCLAVKATSDESMLWHRRLGHINFKNINKLVKDNLVRDFPSKRFFNDQTCVACLKGKQHRAAYKTKIFSSITKPLFKLHMDLFGPTFVSSLMHKKYCLVVTDDYSRFSWVFFLATKDEISEILKNFIKEIENLVDQKVKIIRSDNGTEFKNEVMDDFCREKVIMLELLKIGSQPLEDVNFWEIGSQDSKPTAGLWVQLHAYCDLY
ncbi:putative ribonuclease H-like domain-containing protein [Tanacetum coccineum]|uniref:Ribonuclease H-like domain-containing protein n=1 Tax=Tanacetum coccineum TaxID=301880 RepID=A0ABQ5IZY6_9ASTR